VSRDSGFAKKLDILQFYVNNQDKMRPISRKEIKAYGQQAARLYLDKGIALTKAVINVLEGRGLNVEQIRRVTEEANVQAYLEEFKNASPRKNVTFKGGPADPSVIVKELKYGQGVLPVAEKKMIQKEASVRRYRVKQSTEEVYGLLCKQASVLCDELRKAEYDYDAACDHLAGTVKVAMADEDHSSIAAAINIASSSIWGGNLALYEISQRDPSFQPNGKTKIAGRLDPNHPLVAAVREFEKVAQDLVIKREARRLADKELSEFSTRLAASLR
jgi:hypothetical protein